MVNIKQTSGNECDFVSYFWVIVSDIRCDCYSKRTVIGGGVTLGATPSQSRDTSRLVPYRASEMTTTYLRCGAPRGGHPQPQGGQAPAGVPGEQSPSPALQTLRGAVTHGVHIPQRRGDK